MSDYVVDASVAVKWFVPEVHSEAAGRLRTSQSRLYVPAFFTLEVGNTFCKKVRRREIAESVADVMGQALLRLPLRRYPDAQLYPAAFRLAQRTRCSLYDCLYLALAVIVGCPLVTADRKLYHALTRGYFADKLVWVEDLV